MRNDRKIIIEKNVLNTTLLSNVLELNDQFSAKKSHSVRKPLKNIVIKLKKNKQHLLEERIKAAIYQFIFNPDENLKQNFSEYMSKKVDRNYNYLDHLFIGKNGVTINEYLVAQKIDYVKELLVYSELKLSDIAYKLRYSCEAQLTKQFIQETGISPAFFRLLRKMKAMETDDPN